MHKQLTLLKKIWVALLIPVIGLTLFFYHQRQKSLEQKEYASIYSQVGKKFLAEDFLDRSGDHIQKLDFTKAPLTMVDFWFRECPPCIKEMKQFPGLLKDKEDKIRVISVSFNSYNRWRKLFDGNELPFLKASVPNWEHVVVKSNEDSALNNDLAGDRVSELGASMGIQVCPAYFIVDSSGTIKDVSPSGVNFLKTEFEGKNELLSFVFNTSTWKNTELIYVLLVSILAYSGLFFIALLLLQMLPGKK